MSAGGRKWFTWLPRLKHTKRLIFPLICASVGSVVLAVATPGSSLWHELGVNLVADMASLWFGLFVVEIALEKDRADMRKPARKAMVDDLIRLRRPITHVLSLILWDAATPDDLPELRLVAKGDGDIAKILARRRLTRSPAPMLQLGVLSGPKLTWWQAINLALSPDALRLEVLIARYITVADAPTLAALQRLEASLFMDVLRGRLVFDDDIMLESFWRDLIQSLAALDAELEIALREHIDRGAVLGAASYINFVVGQIERGSDLRDAMNPHGS